MLCSEVWRSRHLCDSSVYLYNFKKRFSSKEKRLGILRISGCKSKRSSNTPLPEKECKLFTLNQMCDIPDIVYPKKQAFLYKNHILRRKKWYFFKCYKVDDSKVYWKGQLLPSENFKKQFLMESTNRFLKHHNFLLRARFSFFSKQSTVSGWMFHRVVVGYHSIQLKQKEWKILYFHIFSPNSLKTKFGCETLKIHKFWTILPNFIWNTEMNLGMFYISEKLYLCSI